MGGSQIAVDAGLRSDAALPRRLRGVTWNAADNATTVWVLRVTFGPRSKTVHVRVESCSVQADSQGMMDSEEYELVEVRARTHTCVAREKTECRCGVRRRMRSVSGAQRPTGGCARVRVGLWERAPQ